jgi:hypothetical protein
MTVTINGSGSITEEITIDGVKVGQGAGNLVTNTAVGVDALAANTTGGGNTAVGYQTLDANTTGVQNAAFGTNALGANTTGTQNTGLGRSALTANTTGAYNTAVGTDALIANTTASANTAVGYQALDATTTGGNNVAVGNNALGANTTAANNTAVGVGALASNTTGASNVAVGQGAMDASTTGSFNTALGRYALISNTTGAENVALGYEALYSNTTPPENTAVGYRALYANTTGEGNTAVGHQACDNITTGHSGVYVGVNTKASAVGVLWEVVVGGNIFSTITGKGDSTGFIAPGGNGAVYQGNNSSSWATTSDQRLKKNIVDNTEGLEKINSIQVRNFEYRLPEEVTELDPSCAVQKAGVQLGVIAQELQQVCPDCIREESTGVLSVDSDNVFWHMVNAIKELSAQVTALQAEVNALKGAE